MAGCFIASVRIAILYNFFVDRFIAGFLPSGPSSRSEGPDSGAHLGDWAVGSTPILSLAKTPSGRLVVDFSGPRSSTSTHVPALTISSCGEEIALTADSVITVETLLYRPAETDHGSVLISVH
jgi:hypothetical protein